MGVGGMLIPLMGNSIPIPLSLERRMEVSQKKRLADVALNTAKSMGATYADVRIGRYLNQFLTTRENKVQNIVNTESFGAGIRVIVNGTWGFASTNIVTEDGIKKTAEQAATIAKANSKFQTEPVKLAPARSHGEVVWKTPIELNPFSIPVSDKLDLLLRAN